MDNRIFLLMGGGGGGTEPVLDTLEVSANGTYTPPAGTDGYDEVIVDVEPALETKSITANGTYTPAQGYDGFDEVTVSVTPALETKSITTNGTYTPSTGKYGFSQVTVNVPSSGTQFNLPSGGNLSGLFAGNNKNNDNSGLAAKYALDNISTTTWNSVSNFDYLFYRNRNVTDLSNITINISYGGCSCTDAFNGAARLTNLPTINGTMKNAYSLFMNCSSLQSIPTLTFDLSSSGFSFEDFAYKCSSITSIAAFNQTGQLQTFTGSLAEMFNGCTYLRNIDFFNNISLDMSTSETSSAAMIFTDCNSLRSIPQIVLSLAHNITSTSFAYGFYYSSVSGCDALDELYNLPLPNVTYSNNIFINLDAYGLTRCSRFAFKTDNGTPFIRSYRKQVLDLAGNAIWGLGYSSNNREYRILNYNSGITIDKKVTSQSTYQELKNDPDWYTCDINYSRYNHDSAVETINSLPDCSAYATGSDVNTIKFNGAAGTNTDGGAISNLTAEEIAVATAKGWTVSIL